MSTICSSYLVFRCLCRTDTRNRMPGGPGSHLAGRARLISPHTALASTNAGPNPRDLQTRPEARAMGHHICSSSRLLSSESTILRSSSRLLSPPPNRLPERPSPQGRLSATSSARRLDSSAFSRLRAASSVSSASPASPALCSSAEVPLSSAIIASLDASRDISASSR